MRAWLATPLAVLAALAACGGTAPPRPRLVVLLATCTLRRDVLSPFDEGVTYTPRLAELAAEGVVFPRHETEAGQSGTDFAALFGGVQADVHGVYFHPRVLSGELELVGEAFAGAGYETWFLNGHRMAASDLGYGQGIAPERTLDVRGGKKRRLLDAGDGALPRLFDELAADPGRSAFVLANFTVTHGPYSKQVTREAVLDFARRFPAYGAVSEAELERWWPFYEEHRLELEWDLAHAAATLGLTEADVAELARVLELTYRTAVTNLDRAVGEVIDAVRAAGLWQETLFCFTADHGEALYRPGLTFHWTHGLQLAPEVLGIPWILRAPGLEPGRYAGVTRSIDVLPTLAGLCGVALAPGRDGVDLAPVLRGRAPVPELLAFSHTSVVGPASLATFAGMEGVLGLYPRTDPALCWVRVRDGDRVLKLVPGAEGAWRSEAFDLAADPEEAHDLFDPADARQRELGRALEAYRARLIAGYERTQGRDAEGPVDEETMARLRELGYAR